MPTWIFQAPEDDLQSWLDEVPDGSQRLFSITSHAASIQAGDTALLWQSGTRAGVVARAVVQGPSRPPGSDLRSESGQSTAEDTLWAPISHPDRVRFPLPRSIFRGDDVLSGMTIIRSPMSSIHRVSETEAARIAELFAQAERPVSGFAAAVEAFAAEFERVRTDHVDRDEPNAVRATKHGLGVALLRDAGVSDECLGQFRSWGVDAGTRSTWARVPWLIVFRPEAARSRKEGTSVGVIFDDDLRRVHVTLHVGRGGIDKEAGDRALAAVRQAVGELTGAGISVDDRLSITRGGSVGGAFRAGAAAHVTYEREALRYLRGGQVERSLAALVGAYKRTIEDGTLANIGLLVPFDAEVEPSPAVAPGGLGPDPVGASLPATSTDSKEALAAPELPVDEGARTNEWTLLAEPEVRAANLLLPKPNSGGSPVDSLVWLVRKHLPDEFILTDDDALLRRAVLALLSGHLVLTGPPGTGKTTLARALADAFSCGAEIVTATADWTTFDLIGGLRPSVNASGARFRAHHGYVTAACLASALLIDSNREVLGGTSSKQASWLIIDELSRAPIDRAFGPLFTVLAEEDPERRELDLWFEHESRCTVPVPERFRIIATMNDADTAFVHGLSRGLQRRFQFVRVERPDVSAVEELKALVPTVMGWLQSRYPSLLGDDGFERTRRELLDLDLGLLDTLGGALGAIRAHGLELGPAQAESVLRRVAVAVAASAVDVIREVDYALVDAVVPQLVDVSPERIELILGELPKPLTATAAALRAVGAIREG